MAEEAIAVTAKGGAKAILETVIESANVFVAQFVDVEDLKARGSVRCFQPREVTKYHPICDDFGPLNLACVTRFVGLLDQEIRSFPKHAIIYCVPAGRRELTNAIFLLGAYLIFRYKATWRELAHCFKWVDSSVAEPFRDATFSEPDFHITLMDCWMGLQRGIDNKWISLPTSSTSLRWGPINIEEYEHYDNPRHGYLHEVIPGKLVAFTGPEDIGPREFRDDDEGYRVLSPTYYVRVFREIGVKTVVRLNEPRYDARSFTDNGIRHVDLPFDDCTAPPPRIVDAFLAVVDAAAAAADGGLVAVHCKAGLGRTGTLIAAYMMRSCGFRAKEAIGWLRIMRPGAVIGEQQHFLSALEAAPAGAATAAEAAADSDDATGCGRGARGRKKVSFSDSDRAAALAAEVAAGMRRSAVAKTVTA